jgi:hypothetical protein
LVLAPQGSAGKLITHRAIALIQIKATSEIFFTLRSDLLTCPRSQVLARIVLEDNDASTSLDANVTDVMHREIMINALNKRAMEAA